MFLFGVLALPACGPEASDDPTVPDGGDPDNFASACENVYAQLFTCYGESPPPQYLSEISEYCADYAEIIEAEYGTDCVAALEEMYSCVASLDCRSLLDGDGDAFAVECREVSLDAHTKCPELIGLCSSSAVSDGGGAGSDDQDICELRASDCLDGHEYSVSCESVPGQDDETPESLSCTCQRSGADMMSVELAGGCWSDEFQAAAEDACGFPDGAFG